MTEDTVEIAPCGRFPAGMRLSARWVAASCVGCAMTFVAGPVTVCRQLAEHKCDGEMRAARVALA